MNKELIESILAIIPNGYLVYFEIKSAPKREVQIRHISFDHLHQIVQVTLCDEYNLG
jgi:hypothetical protein